MRCYCLFVWFLIGGCVLAQDVLSGKPGADAPLTDRERMLLERVVQLEQRVDALEKRLGEEKISPAAVPSQPSQVSAAQAVSVAEAKAPDAQPALSFLDGTTLNLNLDTYYGYNFNTPIGRVNLLRAYDVSSNAISLNQADLIFDNQPDLSKDKRWGFRLDLQYGQATESLQGNPANEPRPDIYRNVFQAYGTYVLPIGKGLTIDFGKFASSLGIEGNYTKDQMNYSRSFWFNALPFYHMGARLNYKFSDSFAVNYWFVNGVQQAEPFNAYKDEFFGLAFTPSQKFSWNVNYYLGQEHPDVTYFPNGGAPPDAPTLQGVPFEPIPNPPKGKLHIFDTYVNWHVTPKWTLAGEADYEIERLYESSTPEHLDGGALYASYQVTPKLSFAGRAEYMSNRGALFGTVSQAAKETTFTAKYQVVNGLDVFGEWRRDFSNQPFFYTNMLNVLKNEQNTATLGLVWWWGGKQGSW
jgi:Putative beta-barrel porin-2, OmpL-like. bbp2